VQDSDVQSPIFVGLTALQRIQLHLLEVSGPDSLLGPEENEAFGFVKASWLYLITFFDIIKCIVVMTDCT
jgi:hypothetical protein